MFVGMGANSPSGYNITDSLRFRSSASAYLNRTPASAGNRKTWTWSAWIKLGDLAGNNGLFWAGTDSNNFSNFMVENDNQFAIYSRDAGSASLHLVSTKLLRDSSAWYHIVISVDTTQATASDRIKMYVNNEQVTSFATSTYPSQNYNTFYNNTNEHRLGSLISTSGSQLYYDGYMAEVNFVDGQALTPSDFGSTNADGVWSPKKYTGTYGTNGFYLPMKETTQADGFNTVLYEGNGGTQSISNVGFSPDLVWIKSRDGTQNHYLQDSVRGATNYLVSNNTGAENQYSGLGVSAVTSFNTDGFSLGTDAIGMANTNSISYVSWCWEAGTTSFDSSAGLFSSGNYLTFANNSAFEVGSDWTLDVYLKPTATGSSQAFYSYLSAGSGLYGLVMQLTANNQVQLLGYNNGDSNYDGLITFGGIVDTNKWTRVTIVRSSGTWSCYLDGQLQSGSGTMTGFSYSGTPTLYIGRWNDTYNNPFKGYINNLRVVKGSALIPTTNNADLTAVTNTQLLTLQDATIVDNSTNGFTVTENGSVTTSTESIATSTINTDGTITSTVRANPDYGFSVVTYTGTGTLNASVGHGLNSAPKVTIVKNRSSSANWVYFTTTVDGSSDFLYLNLNDAKTNTAVTAPTSDVFYTASGNESGASGQNYVAYCFSEVSGYSKFGSYTGNGSTSGPTVTTGFRPAFVMVKGVDRASTWRIYDNTRDQANPPTKGLFPHVSNAESTAEVGPEFLDNGFQISSASNNQNASGEDYIYMAFADTRDYQWNFDSSGNKNNWTPNNINSNASSETTYDLMSDTPSLADEDTGNFATINPLDTVNMTVVDANLKATATADWYGWRATHNVPSTGKYYWEIYVNRNTTVNVQDQGYGLIGDSVNMQSQHPIQKSPTIFYTGTGAIYKNNSSVQSSLTGFSVGDTLGVAVDMDAGTVQFYLNNSAQGTAESLPSNTGYFLAGSYQTTNRWCIANFGQRPFKYTPPTGFKKLNTYNLPDSSITDGSQYFDTYIYTGDGSSTRTLTLPIEADFVWSKNRTTASDHVLIDTVRNGTSPVKTLFSNGTFDEAATIADFGGYGYPDSLSGTSYSVVKGTQTNSYTNKLNDSYVNWLWKAGGTAVSNTDGTITSTVSANTTSGFSIVSYTGNGTSGATVGHGLSQTPELIITKGRDNTASWIVRTNIIDGSSDYLLLDTTAAKVNSGISYATNSVLTLGSGTSENINGLKFITYAFHSVEGFSKIGTYTGNGSTDGPFVYTGFRPAFVVVKIYDGINHWVIKDDLRAGNYNPASGNLYPNLSNAEDTISTVDVDLLSNGFKIRGTYSGTNSSGYNYIYMAFAENPFKNSLAR